MILKNLKLTNFRSFAKAEFKFSPGLTIVIGPNTSGKTNLLEAIYLLTTGKSFRAEEEKEIIKQGNIMSNVKCQMSNEQKLEIILTTGQIGTKKVPRKKYLVNGVSRRQIDFLGNLRAVLFWPEDLELVTDSPARRRKYLDLVLTQVDREYRRCLLLYEKGVRARNRLLERIRDEMSDRSQLIYWDNLLIKNGQYLTEKREEYIDFINNLKFTIYDLQFQLKYEQSAISQERLAKYKVEEIEAGMTLVGPHRDDFQFMIHDSKFSIRNLRSYGSRGEQRLAILWLKICELNFIEKKTGDKPILLLDDIFSELDKENREIIWKLVRNYQTIITSTEKLEKKGEMINLK